MRIDSYASMSHYAEHIAPIVDQLGEYAGPAWSPSTFSRPEQLGDLVVVASAADAAMIGRYRPLVYVEHGAGQSYGGDPVSASNPSYSGGDQLEAVKLFIGPNETVAARWRDRYPATPAVAVGCPKLDAEHARCRGPFGSIVAVTFHWDCHLIAETRSAWGHYYETVPKLVDALRSEGLTPVGHGHPKWGRFMADFWENRIGVPFVSASTVIESASMLIADNTSLAYEFASLDRPVLSLNAPWYRRGVEHGLRFWSHVPGLECDGPEDFTRRAMEAWWDPDEAVELRRRAIEHVYAAVDGQASRRAAAAIYEVINDAQSIRRS